MLAPTPLPAAFTGAVPPWIMLQPWQIEANAEDSGPDPRSGGVGRAIRRPESAARSIVSGAEDGIVD
nr:hypothetical protein [Roseomonas sp. SXEYE001]